MSERHRKLEHAFDGADKAYEALDDLEFEFPVGEEREAVSVAADHARELLDQLRVLVDASLKRELAGQADSPSAEASTQEELPHVG